MTMSIPPRPAVADRAESRVAGGSVMASPAERTNTPRVSVRTKRAGPDTRRRSTGRNAQRAAVLANGTPGESVSSTARPKGYHRGKRSVRPLNRPAWRMFRGPKWRNSAHFGTWASSEHPDQHGPTERLLRQAKPWRGGCHELKPLVAVQRVRLPPGKGAARQPEASLAWRAATPVVKRRQQVMKRRAASKSVKR